MKLKNVLIYLFIVILLFVLSIFSQLELDGIWCYGFSYNIASGLIPYRDFNMVVGPLYSLIMSLFIKLFGNYFLFFSLENSLIFGLVFYFIYKKIGYKCIFLILLIGLSITSFGYNTFCVMLFLSILLFYDSNFKYKNLFIGILLGLIITTKQNIGLVLLLGFLLLNEEKKYILLGSLISIVPIFIYLLINNIVYNYFDFCILGLGSFLDNFYIDLPSALILILPIIYLIAIWFKKHDKKILYIIFFFTLTFPIFDQGHAIPALIPFFYYIFLNDDLNKKIGFLCKYFILIGFVSNVLIIPFLNCKFVLSNNYLFFQHLKKDRFEYLYNYSDYIDNYKDYNLYLFIENAYLIKIYRNENPNIYDLINDGNLGSDINKYLNIISDKCSNDKCIFILDKDYFPNRAYGTQLNIDFKNYVIDKYNYYDTLPTGDRLYKNF